MPLSPPPAPESGGGGPDRVPWRLRTRRATRTFFFFFFFRQGPQAFPRCRWMPSRRGPGRTLTNGPPLGLALLERSCTTVATFCRASTSFRMTSSPRARCPTRLPCRPPSRCGVPGGPRARGAGNAAAEGPIGRRSVLPLRQRPARGRALRLFLSAPVVVSPALPGRRPGWTVPASAFSLGEGGGAGSTASGVPGEASRPGDLAFPQITTPRPPGKKCYVPRWHVR